MNELNHPNVNFHYAGLFYGEGEWIHPDRIESTYEIIYVIQGEVDIREEGVIPVDYHAKKGQLFVLSPHTRHYGTRTTSDVRFYWVHFQWLGENFPLETRFFDHFEEHALFKKLLHFNNLPSIPEYLVNATLTQILAELCYLSQSPLSSEHAIGERICEWIRIYTDAGLSVEKTAKHFGYSPDHLTRICKRICGMGAKELIDHFLILRIKETLCNTDCYVKEIAMELGFSTDKALIGFFRYHEKCSPTEFRNRYGRTHMNRR